MAKTLTPAQCTALRTGTGRAATLAVLVRLELMDDTHTLTRAGRTVRRLMVEEGYEPLTLSHVADIVREIARVNWNAPHTFHVNEAGAHTLADARPLFHNGHAVSVVWHPMTGKAYVYAGTDVIGEREGVDDLHMVDAATWARETVANAVPMADWERELIITGTVAPERPATVEPTSAPRVVLYAVRPDAPLTVWQRSDRFDAMRNAQRTAWDLREEAGYMTRFPREYDAAEVTAVKTDAAQYAHLATWLGDSVRDTPAAPVEPTPAAPNEGDACGNPSYAACTGTYLRYDDGLMECTRCGFTPNGAQYV
jgi:hypothetical protein